MKVLPRDEMPDKEELEPEASEELEQPVWENGGDYDYFYVEYNDEGSNNNMRNKRRGRPKGSRKRQYPWDDVDDKDWSMKEESSHKKRGRPKGSKNKSAQQEKPVQCGLFATWQSDRQAVLAHTQEVHCIDKTSTFPCPLCKAVLPDEGELIHHVNHHKCEATANETPAAPPVTPVKMWRCPLCGQIYVSQEELGIHVLAEHVQTASLQYQCPLCEHPPTSGPRLVHHITDNHASAPLWSCPLCDQGTLHL
ncbi:zinc finger protein 319-like [Nilaparvata lugens]|uniref:zinc finger protein 319-like n=1 Tax=Nilaparvata lugens TaxID=108931 RepID=UPI00193C9D18|nr:zinc finger protein 319-like [Nilaparvata lugens]